jgi:hypothetical protein
MIQLELPQNMSRLLPKGTYRCANENMRRYPISSAIREMQSSTTMISEWLNQKIVITPNAGGYEELVC